MYAKKPVNQAISSKTIRHAHSTLQRAIDYTQKTEREFLLAVGIQQTKFETVLSIDTNAGNDPMRQQWLANIKC